MSICNVAESTITRLSDYSYLMQAGPEISVASTKAFTSQLIALLLLATLNALMYNGYRVFNFEPIQAKLGYLMAWTKVEYAKFGGYPKNQL